MKRVILLIIGLLFLTGCSVNYDLTINEESINEVSKIYTDVSAGEVYSGDLLANFLDSSSKIYEPIYFNDENYDYYLGGYQENVRYYNISNYSSNNYKGIELQNMYSFSDYYRSTMVKQCFDELNIQKSDSIYLIRTSNKCNVFNTYSLLDEIRVNVYTDLEVISSNADLVNNNTYTWFINRDNYTNKSIRMSVVNGKDVNIFDKDVNKEDKKEEEKTSEIEKKESNIDSSILIVGVLVIFVIGLFIIIIVKKHIKN